MDGGASRLGTTSRRKIMKFPTDDLKPEDVERAIKELDESQNGRKIINYFPKDRCRRCGVFRTDIGDGLCKICWNREHNEVGNYWEDER